jgi:holo-[acyl-carrier protein] synthase
MRLRQGIDIVKVRRIQNSIERQGKSFLKKIFSSEEIAYCESKRMKYEHYAARFAAKEAALKVFEGNSKHRFRLRDIEIHRKATGKPHIHLSESSRKRFGLPRKYQLELSMAHEREYAIATVILVLL